MKGKKRVLIAMLLLAAIFLSFSACGGNSSGAPADELAGTADDEAQSTKSVDAKEHTPPEKRLKEMRFVADGTDAGNFVYTYDDKGTPIRLEATNGLSELLDWYSFDYEYDAEGRLTCAKGTDVYGDISFIFQYSQEDGITRAVLSLDEDGDGVPDEAYEGFEFTFDADGYMLSRNTDGIAFEWTYDDAHRVTEEYTNYSNDKYAYSNDSLSTYTYDDNGNLIEECYYLFDPDEFLGGMLAGEGLRPDKSTATYFSQTTYSDLEFNDKGLLTSQNGETWDSDGDAGDVSIDYTYDDEGNLLLEKKTISLSEGRRETTTYHSGNDACIVTYDKTTINTNEYLICSISSDQFYCLFRNSDVAKIFLPYGGSIRLTPLYGADSSGTVPGLRLSDVFDFDDPESYLPENLEFTEDGYLSKLDYGAGNYVELLYE